MKRMAEIGEEGVFALISDSTEAEKPGYNTIKAKTPSSPISAMRFISGA
jgi:ribonuclease J